MNMFFRINYLGSIELKIEPLGLVIVSCLLIYGLFRLGQYLLRKMFLMH